MIYIIRHGQTELNNRKVLQGRSNYPLNESGVRQAEEAAKRLEEAGVSFDRVFTSPLIRAAETARIVGRGVEAVTDERLIEMDYGPYEGMDLQALTPEVITFFSDFQHNPAPDGMEQLDHVVERAGRFVEDLRQYEGESILISTHAIAMKGILEYLTPDSHGAYWSKYIGNCWIYTFENAGGTFSVPALMSV